MALPQTPPLSKILHDARQRWTRTKTTAQNVRSRAASGPISATIAVGLLDNVRTDIAYFEAVAATPGIGAYAAEQYGSGYTIGPDFTAFVSALEDVRDWIVGALPREPVNPADPTGPRHLLLQTVAADGSRTDRTFSVAQTAGLRTVLDALIATVA